MSRFEVGDKVRVRTPRNDADGPGEMANFDGEKGKIKQLWGGKQNWCLVQLYGVSVPIWFHDSELEPVSEGE